MVIFYDKETKEILYTENDTMYPALPKGAYEEKIGILDKENIEFVSVPYEMGTEIFNFKVGINELGEFIGLQPKSKEELAEVQGDGAEQYNM